MQTTGMSRRTSMVFALHDGPSFMKAEPVGFIRFSIPFAMMSLDLTHPTLRLFASGETYSMFRPARTGTTACCVALLAALVLGTTSRADAGGHGKYLQINLTSNVQGMAHQTDRHLVNGWGLAFFTSSPFWVSDNGTGLSTIYDHFGNRQNLIVTVPAAPEQPSGTRGTPTAVVANPSIRFAVSENGHSGPAAFIFATSDGTISGWSPGVDLLHSVIAVDNFKSTAIYTGLEILTDNDGPRLYAADNWNGQVDVFGGSYQPLFTFTDPHVPPGFSVYGIHFIAGRLFVTFAGPGGGVVDMFDTGGHLMRTFASNGATGPLQSPWGIALAPHDFGKYSNALLVGNVADGHISAFDLTTGAFLGQLENTAGHPIAIPGLWSLEFGAGNKANGPTDELFFTAGPDGYTAGLFGKIIELDGN
jgi:uncharacterized protein (TIGR03118 family)